MNDAQYDLMHAWAAALRSGEYKQTTGQLYEAASDGYCCLGVLSAMYGMPCRYDINSGVVNYSYPTSPNGDWKVDSELPSKYWFADTTGLNQDTADAWMDDLAKRNDDGQSFDRIALEIERRAALFTHRVSMPTYPRTVR